MGGFGLWVDGFTWCWAFLNQSGTLSFCNERWMRSSCSDIWRQAPDFFSSFSGACGRKKKNKQTKEERRSDALFDGRGTPRPMVFLSFFFRSWADDSNGIGRLTEFWRDFKDIELVGLVIDYYRYRYIFSELVVDFRAIYRVLPSFGEILRTLN